MIFLVQSGVCLAVLSWVDYFFVPLRSVLRRGKILVVDCPFPAVKGTIFISRLYHVSIGVVSNFFSKYDTFLHFTETWGNRNRRQPQG